MRVKFKDYGLESNFLMSLGIRDIRVGVRDYYLSTTFDEVIDQVNYVLFVDEAKSKRIGHVSGSSLLKIDEKKSSEEYLDKLHEVLREME